MDQTPIFDPQRELPPPSSGRKTTTILALVLLVLLGAGFYYYWRFMRPEAVRPQEQAGAGDSGANVAAATDLGSSMYAQTNNPLSGKLPEPVTTPNPADDFYKNPFQ